LLKQSLKERDLIPNGEFIRLGNKEDLFFKRNFSNLITFSFSGKSEGLFFSERITYNDNGIVNLDFRIENKVGLQGNLKEIVPNKIQTPNRTFELLPSGIPAEPFTFGRDTIPDDKPELLIRETISEFKERFSIFQKLFDKIWYIQPIRGTLLDYNKLSSDTDNIARIRHGEDINDRLFTTIGRRSNIIHIVSKWCKEILDVDLGIRIGPGQTITLETERQSITNENENIYSILVNEGFGLNQLILLLTQLALAVEDSLVIIDEPEIHLHPRAQAKLMEILAKEAIEKNKQLIITTHSEHVLYQALTMIGQKELKKQDLALYYFFKENDGCHCKELAFDKYGRLEETLPGFFEANVDMIKTYLEGMSIEEEKKENEK